MSYLEKIPVERDKPPTDEQLEAWRRLRTEQTIDLIWGIVSGDGSIAGRMASGAPGAIDPSERYRPLAEEFREMGLLTREAISDEIYKRQAEAEAAEDDDDDTEDTEA